MGFQCTLAAIEKCTYKVYIIKCGWLVWVSVCTKKYLFDFTVILIKIDSFYVSFFFVSKIEFIRGQNFEGCGIWFENMLELFQEKFVFQKGCSLMGLLTYTYILMSLRFRVQGLFSNNKNKAYVFSKSLSIQGSKIFIKFSAMMG